MNSASFHPSFLITESQWCSLSLFLDLIVSIWASFTSKICTAGLMFLLDWTTEHLNNTWHCQVISYSCTSCVVKKLTQMFKILKQIFRIISPEVSQRIAFRYHFACDCKFIVHLKLTNSLETFPWEWVANISLLKHRLFLLSRNCLN